MNLDYYIDKLVDIALEEDIGSGDITTDSTIRKCLVSEALILAREDLILSGIDTAKKVFAKIDKRLIFTPEKKEGERVDDSDVLARISGNTASILKGERTALNFLQHLSGIATLTSKYVSKTHSTKTKILDTRKTTPGMRLLEKRAVKSGGGENHRIGLFDMVLIKENHIIAAGNIHLAVEFVRTKFGENYKIEVEVEDLFEVAQALQKKVDIIMLDNMSVNDMKKAINLIEDKAKVEISGNISLESLEEIVALEPDFISVGRITHSAPSVDISLEFIHDSSN